MSAALVGRFFTAEPPGKPRRWFTFNTETYNKESKTINTDKNGKTPEEVNLPGILSEEAHLQLGRPGFWLPLYCTEGSSTRFSFEE